MTLALLPLAVAIFAAGLVAAAHALDDWRRYGPRRDLTGWTELVALSIFAASAFVGAVAIGAA